MRFFLLILPTLFVFTGNASADVVDRTLSEIIGLDPISPEIHVMRLKGDEVAFEDILAVFASGQTVLINGGAATYADLAVTPTSRVEFYLIADSQGVLQLIRINVLTVK